MGRKYEFKPDRNPAVGQYEPNESQTKFNNKSVIIREEKSPYRRPKENNPDPGQYTGDVITFGKDVKTNIGMGNKYIFKADSNPAVGQYEVNESQTKFQNKSVIIREDIVKQRRPAESNPGPGQYDSHLTAMGSDLKGITMGAKYIFKPDSNPAPG